MLGLWQALGKGCLDQEFRGSLTLKPTENSGLTPSDPVLYQEIKDNGFCLSRYEVGEVNRIFQLTNIQDNMTLIARAAQEVSAAAPQIDLKRNLYAQRIIGLCCVDKVMRVQLQEAPENDPNVFRGYLNDHNFPAPDSDELIQKLIILLNKIKNDGGYLSKIDRYGWKEPLKDGEVGVNKCAPGLTYQEEGRIYNHRNPLRLWQLP